MRRVDVGAGCEEGGRHSIGARAATAGPVSETRFDEVHADELRL